MNIHYRFQNSRAQTKLLYVVVILAISTGLALSLSQPTRAQVSPINHLYTSNGWEIFTDFLDATPGCDASMATRIFKFADYETGNLIDPSHIAWIKTQTYDKVSGEFIRESGRTYSNISEPICYDTDRVMIRPVIQFTNSAPYNPVNVIATYINPGHAMNSDLKNHTVEYTIYVGRKTTEPKEIEALFPVEEFVRDSRPTYEARLNRLPNIPDFANPTTINDSLFVTRESQTSARELSWYTDNAGLGVRTQREPATLTDGPKYWWYAARGATIYTVGDTTTTVSYSENYSPSCGPGNTPVRFRLLDENTGAPIDMTGVTGRIAVDAAINGGNSTVSWTNNHLSPEVCAEDLNFNVGALVEFASNSTYGSNVSTLSSEAELGTNADNTKYLLGTVYVPPRPAGLTGSYTMYADTIVFVKYQISNSTSDTFTITNGPYSNLTHAIPYIIDTTPPELSLDYRTGALTGTTRELTVEALARDVTSGLSNVTIEVDGLDDSFTATLPTSFTVYGGMIGGPKDQRRISQALNLTDGNRYRITITGTDAAGNTRAIDETIRIGDGPIVDISADPTVITVGDPVDITWSASNASYCQGESTPNSGWNGRSLSLSAGAGNGTYTVTNANTVGDYTFTIYCRNGTFLNRFEARQSVTVTVTDSPDVPNVTLNVPATINGGETLTLTYSTDNVTTCMARSNPPISGWNNQAKPTTQINPEEFSSLLPGTYTLDLECDHEHPDPGIDNPLGDPKTVTVVPSTTQCNDGLDNDGDSVIDEYDPGCHVDGDVGSDPACVGTNPDCSYDPNDNDETDPAPQCSDGMDNADPEDTLADANDPGCWTDPADPATYDPNDSDETDPVAQCSDGIDNDGDGFDDIADPNCHSDQNPYNPASYDPFDDDESGPLYECNDTADNDTDGLIDAYDPGCHTDNSPDGANPALDPSYDPIDNVEASPVDISLSASDLTPDFAGNSTLTWTISGGAPDTCTATGDVANYSGGQWSGLVSPSGGSAVLNTILLAQTYTIVCERLSDNSSDSDSVTITPDPPVFPDIEITSDQVFARPGEDVQLTWSVSDTTNVSNCTITHLGPVSPNDTNSSGPINAERTFTFECEFYGLPFSDSVTVQVLPQIEET